MITDPPPKPIREPMQPTKLALINEYQTQGKKCHVVVFKRLIKTIEISFMIFKNINNQRDSYVMS